MAKGCRRVRNGSSGSSKVHTARRLGEASYGTVCPQETSRNIQIRLRSVS